LNKALEHGLSFIKTKSKENLNLLIQLAQKLGVEVSVVSEKTAEDNALAAAIKKGKTGLLVDSENFLNKLKKLIFRN